jgi:hypothetical protein
MWQPAIKHDVVSDIRKNPKLSWHAAACICNWVLTSQKGHCLCHERVTPLLSNPQKKSRLELKHFCNNWGLKKGKPLLLIHCDEKLFWGLAVKKCARACKDIRECDVPVELVI